MSQWKPSDEDTPEKEPALAPTLPGRTYENPNEDQHYTPPDDEDDEDDQRR